MNNVWQDKTKVIKFTKWATGADYLPIHTTMDIMVVERKGDNHYPKASTCVFEIEMPLYNDEDEFERCLDDALAQPGGFFCI